MTDNKLQEELSYELNIYKEQFASQVEEFKRIQNELETLKEKYFNLYDLAPAGYVTINSKGIITEANLTISSLLEVPKNRLINNLFAKFIIPEDQDLFYLRKKQLCITGNNQSCEVRMIKSDKTIFWALLGEVLIEQDGSSACCNIVIQDITERISLRERYYTAFKHSPSAMCITRASDGKFIEVNDAFYELIGYKGQQLTTSIGMNMWVDIQERNCVLRKLINDEKVELTDVRFRHENGHILTCQFSANLINIDGVEHVLSSSNDVTKLRQIEKELKESEENYKQLFENSPAAIYQIDFRTGKFTRVNDVMCKYSGYTQEEMLSKPGQEFLTPESYNAFIERVKKMMLGEPVNDDPEYEMITKDGKKFWIQLNAQYIYEDGNIVGSNVVAHNITERKKSEEKFKTLANATWEGLFIHKDGIIIYANDTIANLLGYDSHELIGVNMLKFIASESIEKAINSIKQTSKSFEDILYIEINAIKKDGTIFTVEALGRSIEYEGESVRLVSIRDITEKKIFLQEKKELEIKLQHADKMESIGTLAGGVAHDFNNLLMGIQGCVSLLMVKLDKKDSNYEKLEMIEEQITKGSDLTKQLLGFARGGKYVVKPANINYIIEDSLELFERTKKDITVNKIFDESISTVEVDSNQINQVLMNLFINAGQAMPLGGTLTIETKNADKYIKILITDTGTGIDPRIISKIFDPFFTTKSVGVGTGLGLASVYGIINGHHGTIEVESKLGIGTTFIISLPISDKIIIKEEKKFNGKIIEGTETILIIDDEPIVNKLCGDVLNHLGYNTYSAKDGISGIKIFKEKKDEIDMIVLDMIMPGMSCEQTFTELREIKTNIKILLSSGYSLNGKASSVMGLGCNGFIQKPYNIKNFSNKVREILDQQGD